MDVPSREARVARVKVMAVWILLVLFLSGCSRAVPSPPVATDPGAGTAPAPPAATDPGTGTPPSSPVASDDLTVFETRSPDGQSVVKVVVERLEEDNSLSLKVQATSAAAVWDHEDYADPWTSSPEDLVAWVSDSEFIWGGRMLVDLKQGAQTDLPTRGTLLSWTFMKSEETVEALVLTQGGALEVWAIPLRTGQPRVVYTKKLHTVFGEIDGRISAAPDGSVYFEVPESNTVSVVRLKADGSTSVVKDRAANPLASPDGSYLAYHQLQDAGLPTIGVLDLGTSNEVLTGLPSGILTWSDDSNLLAISGPVNIVVVDVAKSSILKAIACQGQPVLTGFDGNRLSYAELTVAGGEVKKVDRRRVDLSEEGK